MKTIYIDFKWANGKKEKCKPFILAVTRTYMGGAVQVSSGDVYQAITDRKHNTDFIATL